MPIYVDTDKKYFDAKKTGSSRTKAEDTMQKAVKKVIDKADGFTTTQSDGKGYTITLTVSKIETVGLKTKCSLTGAISIKERDKERMVSSSMTGSGTVDGKSEAALLDCVNAVAEDLARKSLPYIRNDTARK